MPVASKETFVNRLLEWGKANHAKFPWRTSSDPFCILIAELMLQRTKAEQAALTYTHFIKKFPDLGALDLASIGEIMDAIRPLGLAYRAPRLKKIAKDIMSKHSGLVPRDQQELLELDGVGLYAASAIRCFAYNQDVAVVDSNVARIVRRVFSIPVGKDPHKKLSLWNFLQLLVPEGKTREFNWAMLDLGRTVCTARDPMCELCPLMQICDYAGKGE
jgi:A/G-specific adenine glycosylase